MTRNRVVSHKVVYLGVTSTVDNSTQVPRRNHGEVQSPLFCAPSWNTASELPSNTKYNMRELQRLGQVDAKKLFPTDNSHTNAEGARRKSCLARTLMKAIADCWRSECGDLCSGASLLRL